MQNIAESLKRQREQILGDAPEEIPGRNTSLLEIAVISLYNRLANRLAQDIEVFRSSGAVLALGAFARGQIGPTMPVPILVIESETTPWKKGWIEEITFPLTEAGWSVDAALGSIPHFLHSSREDVGFFFKLLECRYISGNRQMADQLEKALDLEVEKRRDELLSQLHQMVRIREASLEEADSWLEPDLEQACGGLEDINAIRVAGRIAANMRSLEDAIFRGYLTRQEVDFLQQAEKLFACLVSMIHGISGTSDSVLRMSRQDYLAGKLGYSGGAGLLPAERLLQQVHRFLHGVQCISQEFWARLQESREGVPDAVPNGFLETGLLLRGRKIFIQTDRYPATPSNIVRLFHLSARHHLEFANMTRQWIHHHKGGLSSCAGDPRVKEELLELLRWDEPELPVIRRFYNLGLMAELIPEINGVHGLVQHDSFHLYPIHEHHLHTLMELKKLFRGDYTESEVVLSEIAGRMGDPAWLYLASLLHDMGKSTGKGHAMHGAEMVPAIAGRLGLTTEESDLLRFLVAQHLLIMDNASLRDLADEEMLAQCALVVGNVENLDMLLLLSFADMMATGPRARQKWRDTPVVQLYERVHHLLEKGEPSPKAILERIESVKALVGSKVSDLMDGLELESYFSRLAPRYLLSVSPDAMARHMRLQWQLQNSEETLVLEVEVLEDSAELTIVGWQQPGLLFRAAGILTLHDMNILSAQVFTMNNRMTLLIFQCRLPQNPPRLPDWTQVRSDMKRLLDGKMALDYRIAAHAAGRDHSPTTVRRVPSQVWIDNNSSAVYTILEVYTLDRVGLLYTIARTLFELQIRIFVAKITTKVDQVADVFYIRTRQGEKVTDPEQVEEIRNALLFWLDGRT